TLRLRPDGTLDLSQALDLARTFGDTDITLLLTEIPRLREGRPLIAEIFPSQDIAVLSYPTMGALAPRRRVLDVLISCIVRMTPTHRAEDASRFERRWAQWQRMTDPE